MYDWLNGEHMQEVYALSGNLARISESLDIETAESRDSAEYALRTTADILDYLSDEYDLSDDRSLLSRHILRDSEVETNIQMEERYPDRALNHMEIVLYTFRDLLDGEEDDLKQLPPNIHDSSHERHRRLAEVSEDIMSGLE